MMSRKILFSVLLAVGLGVSLSWLLQATSHAQAGQCPGHTYTVRSTDTLAGIAKVLGVSEADLREANRDAIPPAGQLYVGQVICTPPDTVSLYVDGGASIPEAGTSANRWSNPRLAIEVTYQFTPTTADGEDQWNLITSGRGLVGKRLTMPLQPVNPFRPVTQPDQLQSAIKRQPGPVLLAVRNSDSSPTYTLVFIGDEALPIASLLITNSKPIHLEPNVGNGAPVEQVLGGPRIADVDLRIWLESADSMRWPMEISHISFMKDAREAYKSYGQGDTIGLALMPTALSGTSAFADTGPYQAWILLQHNRWGPAGAVMAANCEQWAGKRGVIYSLLRALSRCTD